MGGEQRREPMAHRWHVRGLLRRNAGFVGIAAIFSVLGVVTTVGGLATPGAGAALLAGVIALAAVPLILVPVYLELRSRPRAAEATAAELAWLDRRGVMSRRWDEVSAVYRHDVFNANNARGQTTVTFADGERVRFDQSLTDYELLADRIQAGAAEALLPAARASLAGGELVLGPVTLRQDGVAVGKGFYPWGEVADYTLFLGTFRLFLNAGKAREPEAAWLHEIPNYAVLVRLLQERGVPFNPARCRTM